jgi:hypothetical protein
VTVQEAISQAEAVLEQYPAPQPGIDPRWQAIIQIGHFIESAPDPVWSFIETWGRAEDPDLRMAVATCLLEHLLECHFDRFISRIEDTAMRDPLFADTVSSCWKFGQSAEPTRATRLERLQTSLRRRT